MPEYIKICKDCGQKFKTVKGNKKLCEICTVVHKKASVKRASVRSAENFKNARPKPFEVKRRKPKYHDGLTLNQFNHLLIRYNDRNGTRYSYGKMMLALSLGTIRKEEFYL